MNRRSDCQNRSVDRTSLVKTRCGGQHISCYRPQVLLTSSLFGSTSHHLANGTVQWKMLAKVAQEKSTVRWNHPRIIVYTTCTSGICSSFLSVWILIHPATRVFVRQIKTSCDVCLSLSIYRLSEEYSFGTFITETVNIKIFPTLFSPISFCFSINSTRFAPSDHFCSPPVPLGYRCSGQL